MCTRMSRAPILLNSCKKWKRRDTFKLILWDQHYPGSKDRQRHYKKEDSRSISLMNIDAKKILKYQKTKFYSLLKGLSIITRWISFICGVKEQLNIQRSINITHHVTNYPHDLFNWCRESVWQSSFVIKNTQQKRKIRKLL